MPYQGIACRAKQIHDDDDANEFRYENGKTLDAAKFQLLNQYGYEKRYDIVYYHSAHAVQALEIHIDKVISHFSSHLKL